jgi:hypothetical protein
MPITRTPIIDDDGTNTTGTPFDNAWKQEFYDQIDAYVGGAAAERVWVPIPYSAANFTADVGQWIVEAADINALGYWRWGKMVSISIVLSSTSLTGTAPTSLYVTVPGITNAQLWTGMPGLAYEVSTGWQPCFMAMNPGLSHLQINRLGYVPWALGTSHIHLNCMTPSFGIL